MDLQQQPTDLQDIFTERTSGVPFPGPWVRVESIISQRGETWKSKALLIYHFKYILFVSSWKFSLFLEFYWLLPSICLLHDAAFCRRVGWWSCVMVTVLLKKRNRQRCLILKHFPGCKCQHARAYFKPHEGICCLCALLVPKRKAQVQHTVTDSLSCIAIKRKRNSEYTVCL